MTNNVLKNSIFFLLQYEHLFAVLYSSVLKVQRVKVPGVKNPRIVIRTHDGAVRLISPVSGTTLTTVFPIVNVEVRGNGVLCTFF